MAATRTDRLRIEHTVWRVDSRLQDLPRRSRTAVRRELRANLRLASSDVGSRRAVHQLGDLRTLAAGYLTAEYGDTTRRPSWWAAAGWLALTQAVALLLGHAATTAFTAGATAAQPHLTATLHWPGVRLLLGAATFTFTDGRSTSVGGAWTPSVYLVMLGGAVVAGRLWRLSPLLRRHPAVARTSR